MLFLNQREKRSVKITFWGARARQMCRIAPRAAGSRCPGGHAAVDSGAEHTAASAWHERLRCERERISFNARTFLLFEMRELLFHLLLPEKLGLVGELTVKC